jgi:DNA-binding GntR family transcriptional regulator
MSDSSNAPKGGNRRRAVVAASGHVDPFAAQEEPVRSESAADIAARRISKAILSGALTPGTRLREESLAATYGVSRTPIREALILLNGMGLVELTRNRGATVLKLAVEDIADVYHVRAVLESDAARLAARRMTNDLIDLLEKSCDRMAELHRASPVEQLAVDTYFHYTIARASGSQRLYALIRQVSAIPEAYRSTIAYSPDDMTTAEHQHRAVATALRKGRSAEVGKLMHRHIDWACGLAILRLEPQLLTGSPEP